MYLENYKDSLPSSILVIYDYEFIHILTLTGLFVMMLIWILPFPGLFVMMLFGYCLCQACAMRLLSFEDQLCF